MSTNAPEVEDGLIYAFELDGKGGAQALPLKQLTEPAVGDRWMHFDFTDRNAREWLSTRSGLDGVVVEALLDEDSRPRVVRYDNGVLLILRGVNSNPGADPEDMVSIRLWLEPHRIISTRRRRLLSVVNMRESLQRGDGPEDVAHFVLALIDGLESRIAAVIDSLDAEIEAAEDRFAATESATYSGEFSELRRQAARIRRYLAPQREALERLSRELDTLLSADQLLEVREDADQITRHLEDLDLVRERAILAQEELLGRLANEQNRRMYVLSLVAAIFLPLSFLTGLLGMNVAGLPGLEDPDAFGVSVGAMLVAAVAILVVFKWQKWL